MPPPDDRLRARLAAAQDLATAPDRDALLVTSPIHLRYLFGLDVSAGAALVLAGRTLAVADQRYVDVFRDAGTRLGVDVVPVARGDAYETAIAAAAADAGVRRMGIEADHLTVARRHALSEALRASGAGVCVDTTGLLAGKRVVKDAWELGVLREAGRRLAEVAACILPKVSDGPTERQLAWEIDQALRNAGFDKPAFETIVASGPNAARPHHRPTTRQVEQGDLVVVDFGGLLDGYAVDMTRTVVGRGVPAERRRWVRAVAAAQEAAIAAAAPGTLPSSVDDAARSALAAEGLADYFVHGTGHGLGLEVHERPWIAPRGDADGPLLAGMVFTVEPGVYLPPLGGVRIEDDVVVTPSGVERLTGLPPTNEIQ
ncbi:MAG: Xaa-Pro peptidase family protein [Vicinamibacterales bacterium]